MHVERDVGPYPVAADASMVEAMTATLVSTDRTTVEPSAVESNLENTVESNLESTVETDEIGFGRSLFVGLAFGIVGVWALTTVAMGAYLDNYGAAAGLGAYLAFWIGGGTGFMAGAIRWGVAQEEH